MLVLFQRQDRKKEKMRQTALKRYRFSSLVFSSMAHTTLCRNHIMQTPFVHIFKNILRAPYLQYLALASSNNFLASSRFYQNSISCKGTSILIQVQTSRMLLVSDLTSSSFKFPIQPMRKQFGTVFSSEAIT